MATENILIVDDDKNMRELLSLRLETEGYKATAIAGAEDELKMTEDELFDLALIDLKLTGKENGIDLMERMHRVAPEMPVIILTAYGTIDTAVEAMKRGAYSYLTKPFNRRELLLQIKNGLEKRSQKTQGFGRGKIWIRKHHRQEQKDAGSHGTGSKSGRDRFQCMYLRREWYGQRAYS
jgi:DNA-binding NtrC family response regulator